jgi:hypothetical protein
MPAAPFETSPVLEKRGKAASRRLEASPPALLALLLEGVEDIDSLLIPGDVEDAKGAAEVNTNLYDPTADTGHRLPVVGQQAALDPVKLVASRSPRLVGEGPHVVTG